MKQQVACRTLGPPVNICLVIQAGNKQLTGSLPCTTKASSTRELGWAQVNLEILDPWSRGNCPGCPLNPQGNLERPVPRPPPEQLRWVSGTNTVPKQMDTQPQARVATRVYPCVFLTSLREEGSWPGQASVAGEPRPIATVFSYHPPHQHLSGKSDTCAHQPGEGEGTGCFSLHLFPE